jgi:hypothetical protein
MSLVAFYPYLAAMPLEERVAALAVMAAMSPEERAAALAAMSRGATGGKGGYRGKGAPPGSYDDMIPRIGGGYIDAGSAEGQAHLPRHYAPAGSFSLGLGPLRDASPPDPTPSAGVGGGYQRGREGAMHAERNTVTDLQIAYRGAEAFVPPMQHGAGGAM